MLSAECSCWVQGLLKKLAPIYLAELIRPLFAELNTLLRSLEADDWNRPTVAGRWRVRDVAAHMLDTTLRKVAAYRDGHVIPVEMPIASEADLAGFVNSLNAGGVSYGARLSTRQLTDLLEITARWTADLAESLDPHALALWPVSWAGETASENWMDTGREYTERWHHQMQIRDAVGAGGLLQRRWLYPLLDLSVRAFGRAYEGVPADPEVAVVFEVHAEGENIWSIVRQASSWVVLRGRADGAAATVRVEADTAWRLLYNALSFEDARARVRIDGDRELVKPMLRARSVMV